MSPLDGKRAMAAQDDPLACRGPVAPVDRSRESGRQRQWVCRGENGDNDIAEEVFSTPATLTSDAMKSAGQ